MEMPENHLQIDMNSFSDGQTQSKLWLCEQLESHFPFQKPVTLWIYGSWYGLLAHYLLIRQRIPIQKICLFDIDVEALAVSKKILDSWLIRGPQIEFFNLDCNKMDLRTDLRNETAPDIVINTSCEHFENHRWIQNLPAGTLIVAQSTDMPHPTHINAVKDLKEMKTSLGLKETLFENRLYFLYPNLSFFRYMLIGFKPAVQ